MDKEESSTLKALQQITCNLAVRHWKRALQREIGAMHSFLTPGRSACGFHKVMPTFACTTANNNFGWERGIKT